MRQLARATMFLVGLSCAALLPREARAAAASREIETKVALENSLEKRLHAVLSKVLDTEEIIVIVNVELMPDSDPKSPEILPGVPLKANPAMPGALGLTLAMVRRVSATILLDQSARNEDLQLAEKTASGILGISKERGDHLSLERMRFRRPQLLTPQEFLRPGVILSSLWLLLACLALLIGYAVVYRRFLFPLLRLATEAMNQRTADAERTAMGDSPDAQRQQAAQQPAVHQAARGAEGNGHSDSKLPFSFIEERHLSTINYLLRKAQPLTAAVIVHYMPPRMAALVLTGMTREMRRDVVGLMSQVTQLDEAQVRSMEEWMRGRLDYVMGGEEKLVDILDESGAQIRRELLDSLRGKDRKLFDRLSTRIVLLEDLAALETPEIKLLSRRIPIRSLATVLKYSDSLREAILPKLTAGIGQWLSQEIQLSGDTAPDKLAEEQRRVLSALQQLVREGLIALRKAPYGERKTSGAVSRDEASPRPDGG